MSEENWACGVHAADYDSWCTTGGRYLWRPCCRCGRRRLWGLLYDVFSRIGGFCTLCEHCMIEFVTSVAERPREALEESQS